MKTAITFLFLVASLHSSAQVEKKYRAILNDSPNTKIEFFAFPCGFYNHANIGFSFKSAGSLEHKFGVASALDLMLLRRFNLNVSYNLNTYFKNNKNYIPIWFKASNTRRNIGYEDGYYPHTLRFSIGTGFGRLFTFGEKWGLRTELGVGALVNLTHSDNSGLLALDFKFSKLGFDQYYPDHFPHVLPSFRFSIAFVRVFEKRTVIECY